MNPTDNTPRKDPLIDAYRQASEHEGARPSASVRAAVLAHARVVAQSAGASAAQTDTVNETIRATPAANESSPIWRLAAGVVVGLLGVWLYQLSQPSTRSDSTLASASAPAPASPGEKAKIAQPAPAAAAASGPVEAAVAVAAPVPTVPVAAARPGTDTGASRARADSEGAALKRQEPAAEPAIAMATGAAQSAKKELSVATADRTPGIVGAPASAAAAESANSAFAAEASRETRIASAELRKSATATVRDESSVAATPAATPAVTAARPAAPPAPNAFPAQVAGASAPPTAAVPPPAAAVASGALSARGAPEKSDAAAARPQAATRTGEPSADRPAQLGEVDQSMFTALRTGNTVALRAAIARGANVNIKDERGRTPIQVARERNDAEALHILEASGAR